MYDRADETFANALDFFLHQTLIGDEKHHGLYRTVLGSSSWDEFNRARGSIQAYEAVRDEMRAIIQRMNGNEAPAQVDRRMN